MVSSTSFSFTYIFAQPSILPVPHHQHHQVAIANNDDKGIQLQTHPNVDKKAFAQHSVVGPKNPDKPFPVGQDIGVLKWRFQSQDEAHMPLSINCWPNDNGEVNIEYELEQEAMQLEDVTISIPCPSGREWGGWWWYITIFISYPIAALFFYGEILTLKSECPCIGNKKISKEMR